MALTLSPGEADLLRTNSMRAFHFEQDGRFVPLAGGDLTRVGTSGTMHWCATGADALLLLRYEEACGYDAVLLGDEASGPHGDSFVVLTSQPWEDLLAGRTPEPPAPTPRPELDAATALWHAIVAALDSCGINAYSIAVSPDRWAADGDGGRPEGVVYLQTDDPADVRALASHFGLTEDMEEREEVKERGDGTTDRVRYYVIERDRYHNSDGPPLRLWTSISTPVEG